MTAANSPAVNDDRIVTIPNGITLVRLIGVPVFLWLLLGPHWDGAALVVLMIAGLTDWADGAAARKLNQFSKVGALADPAIDRLYILATLIGFTIRGIAPWWLAALVIGRDALLFLTIPVLRHYGYGPLPVHYLGKAATFNLLYAFPFLLLGENSGTVGDVARPIAWGFTIWGVSLYVWACWVYLVQVARLVRASRAADRLVR